MAVSYTDLNIVEDLKAMDEKFRDDYRPIIGMTAMSFPGYTSSPRMVMLTNHLKQLVNIINGDMAKVLTGVENLVGKYNRYSKYVAEDDLVIVRKIERFSEDEILGHLYYLVTYDEKTDTYDIIQKQTVEDLTERFGYRYNTANMDSKIEGEVINKGEVLYSSVSYDNVMNYCYGKNCLFMYLLDNDTLEDAIKVSRSLAESMKSTQVDNVRMSLNGNDILANWYGDKDNYQPLPEIGQSVRDNILAVTKRINNSRMLYEMRDKNLRNINFTSDTPYYCEGKVEDIVIYSNKTYDEIPDNRFNAQIKRYLKMQEEFYQALYEETSRIIESGSKYSDDIGYQYNRAKRYLDEKTKWLSDSNVPFDNMVIDVLLSYDIPLTEGQKLAGRYGNKGVISKICEDDEMPFTEDGVRADIIINSLGLYNRVTGMPMIEQSLTFIGRTAGKHIATLDNLKDKADIVFNILDIINPDACKKMYDRYLSLDDEGKDNFMIFVEEHGIYYNIPPIFDKHPELLFDRIKKIYDTYGDDWLKIPKVYIRKFGRVIPMMRPVIIGEQYFLRLKQTSKKGFTARSTGSISKRGTPEKSNKSKNYRDTNPKTPIRVGCVIIAHVKPL